MSSRFPPTSSDSRYPPRDHSPSGSLDRRTSAAYNGPSSSRNSELPYRGNASHCHSSQGRDVLREAPRGPKATLDTSRVGGSASRGRGYAGRGDSRDTRDVSFQRRDDNREWPRRESFENRDRRPSPVVRNRSRTPPARDYREPRELPLGHLDLSRVQRGSRDGPLSASSTASEVAVPAGFYGRVGHRGRGRGDRELRGRGRGNFSGDRDTMRTRSRSRERTLDRESREERPRELDRELGRRDDEKRYLKKDWERDSDRFRRDTPPPRPGSRTSSGSHTRPSTPHSMSMPPSSLSYVERSTFKSNAPIIEGTRRPSTASIGIENHLREDNRSYQAVSRADSSRPLTGIDSPFSLPRPTQAPVFGSMTYKASLIGQTAGNHLPSNRDEPPSSAPARFNITDPIRAAPKAPKAELAQAQPPTGPKGGLSYARRPQPGTALSPARIYDSHNDARPPSQGGIGNVSNVAIGRYGAPQRQAVSQQTFAQPPSLPATQVVWSANSRTMIQNANRSGHPEPSTTPNNTAFEQTSRFSHADLQSNAPSASAIALSPVRVPRGPRANTQPSIRAPMGPRLGHNTWVNPNWRPSIMNPVPPTDVASAPSKRDDTREERSSSRLLEQPTKQSPHDTSKLRTEQPQSKVDRQQVDLSGFEEPEKTHFKGKHSTSPPVPVWPCAVLPVDDVIQGVPNQPSSGSEEDDGMNLDEDDFKEAEKNHTREVQKLNSKRPSTPRHHTELLPLLNELDALASAAEDLANGLISKFDDRTEGDLLLGLPSPESEDVDQMQPDTADIGKKQRYGSAESPAPSENLPFLVSGPPTPLSEVSIIRKGCINHERIKDQLFEFMSEKQSQTSSEYKELRAEYGRLYKDWKLGVEALDQEKKLQDEATGATPSPVPTEAPSLVPVPVIETRRAGRATYNMSELDVLRVMEISKKETAEAEELRERQAQKNTSFADLQREAVVPDMLNPLDMKVTIFEDANHLIPTRKALEALAFSEPTRKLTEEEHVTFDYLYMSTPKKWGLIAEAFPKYDYQDIIKHYYITKHDPEIGKYKDKLKKISERGRPVARGRAKGLRGKPTAMMGRGVAAFDGPGTDIASPPRTQAGRPRRTAAPTFGEREALSENDPTTTVPTPARRGGGSNRIDTGGDATSDRPPIKRTRTTQRSDKGTKRPKAPLLAAAPGPSPSRKEMETNRSRSKSKEPKVEEQLQPLDMEEPQVLLLPDVPQAPVQGIWSNGPRASNAPAIVETNHAPPQPVPTGIVQQQLLQQQQQQQQFSQESHGRAPQQTTSYWSVPDQQDFVRLVEFYGTDWQQISQTLKTKTHTMVKNYFFREIERGRTELQLMADKANERIKRGEQTDNPPQSSLIAKRRVDTIPHNTTQRPLAPNAETMDIEMGSPVYHSNAPLQVSPSHHGQSAPRLAPLLQAGTVPNPGPMNAMTYSVGGTNVPIQSTPQSQRPSQSLQGPRAGFFPADRSSQSVTQPGPTTGRSQQSSHQHVHQQQQQQHEFEAEMARLHKAKHELEDHRTMPLYSQPAEQQSHTSVSSHVEHNQHSSSVPHGRTVSSASFDLERKHRITAQQQQSPIDPSPPPLRRLDSRGQAPLLSTHTRSPQTARPLVMSPPQELVRPSSVPANTIIAPVQPPPKPAPVQAKRSNIMSILNDEPSDPQPRKSLSDHRILAATPPPRSPASSAPMYQQSSQSLTQFSRRDPIVEATQIPPPPPPLQQQQTQQAHLSYQQLHQQMQHQQHQTQLQQKLAQQTLHQRPPQQRDAGNNWQAAVQRPYIEQRSSFQQHSSVPISPHPQPAFLQPPSRNTFQSLQPVQAPSPPLLSTHSRASSYTGLHPQQNHQQAGALQSSQPLQPSPYAQMHPLQHPQQLQPHPQQSQQSRPQSAFAISNTPQEHPLRQQQQDSLRQQQDAMRQQDYENAMRQQIQQQQQEVARQEQSRVQSMQRPYSPPQFSGRGAYKTGLQQLPDQIRKPRGYEDPR